MFRCSGNYYGNRRVQSYSREQRRAWLYRLSYEPDSAWWVPCDEAPSGGVCTETFEHIPAVTPGSQPNLPDIDFVEFTSGTGCDDFPESDFIPCSGEVTRVNQSAPDVRVCINGFNAPGWNKNHGIGFGTAGATLIYDRDPNYNGEDEADQLYHLRPGAYGILVMRSEPRVQNYTLTNCYDPNNIDTLRLYDWRYRTHVPIFRTITSNFQTAAPKQYGLNRRVINGEVEYIGDAPRLTFGTGLNFNYPGGLDGVAPNDFPNGWHWTDQWEKLNYQTSPVSITPLTFQAPIGTSQGGKNLNPVYNVWGAYYDRIYSIGIEAYEVTVSVSE